MLNEQRASKDSEDMNEREGGETINGRPLRDSGWRMSKEIPVSVVSFLIIQTLALTWFLAGQSKTLNDVVEQNKSEQVNKYTKEDARHEREFVEQKIILLQSKSDEETRRISILEGQVNGLLGAARK